MSKAANDETGDTEEEDGFVIKLKDGTPYDQAVSGLQKMVRRGEEEDALFLAIGLFDSGYGLGLARRLPIIASEDVGLASPEVVAQVCTLCLTWITLKKQSKNEPDSLPLIFAVMLMCRAPKNREVDDACVVVRELVKRGEKTVNEVIEVHQALVIDSHTARGKEQLRKKAAETGQAYEHLSWEQFYTEGAILNPRVELVGNPWGRRAYVMFGFDYDELNSNKHKSHD